MGGWRGIIVLHNFESSDPTILFNMKALDIVMQLYINWYFEHEDLNCEVGPLHAMKAYEGVDV